MILTSFKCYSHAVLSIIPELTKDRGRNRRERIAEFRVAGGSPRWRVPGAICCLREGRDGVTSVGGRMQEGSRLCPGLLPCAYERRPWQWPPYPICPHPYPHSAHFTHGLSAKNHLLAIFSAPWAFGWTLSRMVSFCGSKPVAWSTITTGASGRCSSRARKTCA